MLKRSTYLFPIKFTLNDYRFRPHIRAIRVFFGVLRNMRVLAPKSISTPLGTNEKRCRDCSASKKEARNDVNTMRNDITRKWNLETCFLLRTAIGGDASQGGECDHTLGHDVNSTRGRRRLAKRRTDRKDPILKKRFLNTRERHLCSVKRKSRVFGILENESPTSF